MSRPCDVALSGTEADRLVLHQVTGVDDAFPDVCPRSVAAVLGEPRGPVNGRCDEATLRPELALAAPPQVAHDLLRGLHLLLFLRLLVDALERALRRVARREVAAR